MTIQKERLVTLSDGTCMNDILYVIHTDAPVLVLKELEMQLGNSSPQRLLESRWSNRSMKDLAS